MSESLGYTPALPSEAQIEAKNGTIHRGKHRYFNRGYSDTTSTKKTTDELWREHLLFERNFIFDTNLIVEHVSGLNVGVARGKYRKTDGTMVDFAGNASYACADSTTDLKLWIDVGTNTVSSGAAWPGTATSYVPLCLLDTAGGTVVSESIRDARGYVGLWIPPAAAAISGTDAATFTVDQDNAGGATTQIAFNRGSTAADALVEWDETLDRFEFWAASGGAMSPIDCGGVYCGATLILGATGKLQSVAIDATVLYTFGPNSDSGGRGLALAAAAAPGAPAAGSHAAGELHVDSAFATWVCTSAGTPGTWKRIGDLSVTRYCAVEIPSSSGASPRDVTLQVRDGAGNAVTEATYLQVGVYADADGADVSGDGTISVVTYGTDVAGGQHEGAAQGTKIKIVKTDASGRVGIRVTKPTNGTVYLLAGPAPRSPRLDCTAIGTITIS